MPKLNALVAGSTGYIGVQLIKLLVKHKYINIKYLRNNPSVIGRFYPVLIFKQGHLLAYFVVNNIINIMPYQNYFIIKFPRKKVTKRYKIII